MNGKERKEAFFAKSEEGRASHQMTASQLSDLISIYNEKYNIHIVMNGVTEDGKKAIEQRKQSQIMWDTRTPTLTQKYHDDLKTFISSLLENHKDEYNHKDQSNLTTADKTSIIRELTILHEEYLKIAKDYFYLKPYPEAIKEIITSLDQEENPLEDITRYLAMIKEYKEFLGLFKTMCEFPESLKKFKDKLSEMEMKNQEVWNDIGMTKKEAIEEINHIRKDLKEGEVVCYVFTNGHLVKKGHFEVFIISKDSIIKPCEWIVDDEKVIGSNEIDSISCLEMKPPFFTHENPECDLPVAQADPHGCGTLGLLTLKELLKNNSEQLKNLTMNVPYYDQQGKICYFFIPSPQVLRYSQSSTYNKIIAGIFSDQLDPVRVPFKQKKKPEPFCEPTGEILEDTVIVQPLEVMLNDTLEKARKKGDKEIIEICKSLLEIAPEFRAHWLEKYEASMSTRDTMQAGTLNAYLVYSSHRLRDKADEYNQKIKLLGK
jgi:hypothetical protein